MQYEGALYHVINRGNYRLPVFGSPGAARAFAATLAAASAMHRGRIHAYAVMRNHFHLALETPQPNLAAGMHWLESIFATRFNRFRSENGHEFQGRYQPLLVEDTSALFRVINYIHLNPVAAGLVEPRAAADFRWSSPGVWLAAPGPPGWRPKSRCSSSVCATRQPIGRPTGAIWKPWRAIRRNRGARNSTNSPPAGPHS